MNCVHFFFLLGLFARTPFIFAPKVSFQDTSQNKYDVWSKSGFCLKPKRERKQNGQYLLEWVFVCGSRKFCFCPWSASTKRVQISSGRRCYTFFNYKRSTLEVSHVVWHTSFSLSGVLQMLVFPFKAGVLQRNRYRDIYIYIYIAKVSEISEGKKIFENS